MNRNEMTEIYELMDFLKDTIRSYKYDKLTYEQFSEMGEQIDRGIEKLESYSKLLALPFKLQLGRY